MRTLHWAALTELGFLGFSVTQLLSGWVESGIGLSSRSRQRVGARGKWIGYADRRDFIL